MAMNGTVPPGTEAALVEWASRALVSSSKHRTDGI